MVAPRSNRGMIRTGLAATSFSRAIVLLIKSKSPPGKNAQLDK